MNPFYLHYALRLPGTLEQFRKWSIGSSYPAILDADVKKPLIPVPDEKTQDEIAAKVVEALHKRAEAIARANNRWSSTLDVITASLCGKEAPHTETPATLDAGPVVYSLAEVRKVLEGLPPLRVDNNRDETEDLLAEL